MSIVRRETRPTWGRLLIVLMAAGLVAGAATANQDLVGLQDDPNHFAMPNANYFGWNYSPLDQINRDNVQDLSVAWTWQSGILDQHEAQPLVIGDTMYVVTPKPNYVYALDLTPGNEGLIKWEYRPDMPEMETAIARACCGAQTRGLAYADGTVVYNTLDGQVIALDAEIGEVLWIAQNTNLQIAETMSTMPLIVGNNVIVGVMGGEFGVRGHVTAYDLDTGNLRWRYYSMGPNNEVGIGPRYNPAYEYLRMDNPALDSWYGDSWRRGGGTIWGWFTFDPDLNMFYYTTGNCGPWNPDYRRPFGQLDLDDQGRLQSFHNNFCASQLARDATTGELIWAYNITPQDAWDLDEPNISVLVDLEIDGAMVPALVRPARNGYFYVWDRRTGELAVEPWMHTPTDFMTGVDMETGLPFYDVEKMMFTEVEDRQRYLPDAEDTLVEWCPGIAARNWQNDAYSPSTGLYYFNTSNGCSTMRVIHEEYVPGESYRLREFGPPHPNQRPGEFYGREDGEVFGRMVAVDPATSEIAWDIVYTDNAANKPILATGGDLLFTANNFGQVVAIDARTGEEVWTFRAGSNFNNSPITYTGPDGRQYVAIIASQGPSSPAVGPNTAADAVGRYRRAGTTLYVFALPHAVAGVAD